MCTSVLDTTATGRPFRDKRTRCTAFHQVAVADVAHGQGIYKVWGEWEKHDRAEGKQVTGGGGRTCSEYLE